MNKRRTRTDIEKRVLFILHRGWVEARLLALAGLTEQLHELADALEPVPMYLLRRQKSYLESIRLNLSVYEDRYRGNCFEYLAILDRKEPPEF